MSHGKVIKNRSSRQAHSLKVYMISLLLSLYCSLLFLCVCLFFIPSKLLCLLCFCAASVFLSEKCLFMRCEILLRTLSSNVVFYHTERKKTDVALMIEPTLHQSKIMHTLYFISGVIVI